MYIGFHVGLTTYVVAAPTTGDLDAFQARAEDAEVVHYTTLERLTAMDILCQEEFAEFTAEPYRVEHADTSQQAAFCANHKIKLVSRLRAIAAQQDMVEGGEAGPEPVGNQTIAELTGTDQIDHWDVRDEETRARDEAQKQAFDDAQKRGAVTDESFGEATPDDASGVTVTDINATTDRSGKSRINSAIAVKDASQDDPDAPQVEEGVTLAQPRQTVDAPRPWNHRKAEWEAMSEAERAAEIGRFRADEFLFTGQNSPARGVTIFIVPRDWFRAHDTLWDGPLMIDDLLPQHMREIGPGRYQTNVEWLVLTQELSRRGFIEDLWSLGTYVNTITV